jgi:ribulose-5-phosphate 4-epimerase/fuculose-1-phosphate aldolase
MSEGNVREINELVELCRFGGDDFLVTQGSGGNASVKSLGRSTMWIKASGCRMGDVSRRHGWMEMRIPEPGVLARAVEGREHDAANASMSGCLQSLVTGAAGIGGRPSMEAWFHLALDRVVLHTHPVYANAFACMEGGAEKLRGLLGPRVEYLEYFAPGHLLGDAIERKAIAARRCGTCPRLWILANHGVIATAEDGAEAMAVTRGVLDAGFRYFGPIETSLISTRTPGEQTERFARELRKAVHRQTGRSCCVRPATRGILVGPYLMDELNPLVPDDAILNGRRILHAATVDEALSQLNSLLSAVIQIDGSGLLFCAPSEGMTYAMEEQLAANALVHRLIAGKGRVRTLPDHEIDLLLGMDSEKYRQTIVSGTAIAGEYVAEVPEPEVVCR